VTGTRTTDDLIRDLAKRPVPSGLSRRWTAGSVAGAALLAVLLFWLAFGLRPDLSAAIAQPSVLAKSLLPLLLSAGALWLAVALARPDARVPVWPLVIPPLFGVVLVGLRLAEGPNDTLWPEMLGQTAAACLVSITILSLLPLAVGLAVLRRWAPARPALTGALLGLASAGGIAAGYALHCTEDSPLFFLPWYSLAICLAAGIGALAGRQLLRW
jgi:hypothetical protein